MRSLRRHIPVLIWFVLLTFVTANHRNDAQDHPNPPLGLSLPLNQQRNFTLSPIQVYVPLACLSNHALVNRTDESISRSPNNTLNHPLSALPDPWVYWGTKGLYKFSNYQTITLTEIWAATFMLSCFADLFNAISEQNRQPSQAYPGGSYQCKHDFSLPRYPTLEPFTARLQLNKVAAPRWEMTFANLAYDVETIWYAFLWFQELGVPNMDIEVHRFVNGESGPTFLAERGWVAFEFYSVNNVSVS